MAGIMTENAAGSKLAAMLLAAVQRGAQSPQKLDFHQRRKPICRRMMKHLIKPRLSS
jgi:hypothetical protein